MSFRVMRVYSTHTKKKAYSVSKMTSGSAGEGEVSANNNTCYSLAHLCEVTVITVPRANRLDTPVLPQEIVIKED